MAAVFSTCEPSDERKAERTITPLAIDPRHSSLKRGASRVVDQSIDPGVAHQCKRGKSVRPASILVQSHSRELVVGEDVCSSKQIIEYRPTVHGAPCEKRRDVKQHKGIVMGVRIEGTLQSNLKATLSLLCQL